MSSFGGPISSTFAGSASAQERISRSEARRDRERSEVGRRFEDTFAGRVAATETEQAIQQAAAEDERKDRERRESEQQSPHDESGQTGGSGAGLSPHANVIDAVETTAGDPLQALGPLPTLLGPVYGPHPADRPRIAGPEGVPMQASANDRDPAPSPPSVAAAGANGPTPPGFVHPAAQSRPAPSADSVNASTGGKPGEPSSGASPEPVSPPPDIDVDLPGRTLDVTG